MTPQQLSEALAERLKPKFGNAVQVNVQIVRVQKIYLSGEVRRPGVYPLEGPMNVMEAIVRAGGPNDLAKVKSIYILRAKEKLPVNLSDVRKGKNLEQNVALKDGDVIVVP